MGYKKTWVADTTRRLFNCEEAALEVQMSVCLSVCPQNGIVSFIFQM